MRDGERGLTVADHTPFNQDKGEDDIEDAEGGELVRAVPGENAPSRLRADRVVLFGELLRFVRVLLLLQLADFCVGGARQLNKRGV